MCCPRRLRRNTSRAASRNGADRERCDGEVQRQVARGLVSHTTPQPHHGRGPARHPRRVIVRSRLPAEREPTGTPERCRSVTASQHRSCVIRTGRYRHPPGVVRAGGRVGDRGVRPACRAAEGGIGRYILAPDSGAAIGEAEHELSGDRGSRADRRSADGGVGGYRWHGGLDVPAPFRFAECVRVAAGSASGRAVYPGAGRGQAHDQADVPAGHRHLGDQVLVRSRGCRGRGLHAGRGAAGSDGPAPAGPGDHRGPRQDDVRGPGGAAVRLRPLRAQDARQRRRRGVRWRVAGAELVGQLAGGERRGRRAGPVHGQGRGAGGVRPGIGEVAAPGQDQREPAGPVVYRNDGVLAELARAGQLPRPVARGRGALGDHAQADAVRSHRRDGRGADRGPA